MIGARRMVITRSRDEEIADDDDDDVTDPTDSVVTHSQEIAGDVDGDATELSGVPFWAVDAETEFRNVSGCHCPRMHIPPRGQSSSAATTRRTAP